MSHSDKPAATSPIQRIIKAVAVAYGPTSDECDIVKSACNSHRHYSSMEYFIARAVVVMRTLQLTLEPAEDQRIRAWRDMDEILRVGIKLLQELSIQKANPLCPICHSPRVLSSRVIEGDQKIYTCETCGTEGP